MYPNFSGQVFGQYQLQSVIGRGGMAVVYRARQVNLERDVAVKIISAQAINTINLVARFKREADLIARLEHPHILPIYDYGQHEDYLYLVLRLMEGGSLDQRIKGHPLPLDDIDRLIQQIGSALDYAHTHDVVHRDLKPNNILLDNFGNAYLMDFGIAKILSATNLTTTSTLMGTPAYMAPEQWRMETVDHRADIYSMGIILYEMVTGEVPFDAPTPHQLMYAHLHKETPPPSHRTPGLLPTIDTVILKATAKKPAERYQSGGELASALSQAIKRQEVDVRGELTPLTLRPISKAELHDPTTHHEGELLTQRPVGTPAPHSPDTTPLPRPATTTHKRRRWLTLGIAALAVGLVLIGVVALLSNNDNNDSSTNAIAADTATTTVRPSAVSPSATVVPSVTNTTTSTASATSTHTSTNSVTATPSPTSSPSLTETPTASPTETSAPEIMARQTGTAQAAQFQALTQTATLFTLTPSATQTITPSPTNTRIGPTNTPFFLPGPTPTSAFLCPGKPASRVSVGMRARTTFIDGTPTRLRVVPDGDVLEGIPEGFEVDVVGGPVCTDTFTWWQVQKPEDGTIGWMAEGDADRYYIEPAPGHALPTLRALQISSMHRAPDVRASASNTSALITTLRTGDRLLWNGRVIVNEDLSWAVVTTYDGQTGYLIYRLDWVTEVNPRTTTPGIAISQTVRISPAGNFANLRTDPGTNATSLFAIPQGTTLIVSGGPVFQDYFVWWQLELSNGMLGWMADRPGWFEVLTE